MVRKIVESRRIENSIVRQEDKGAHLIDLIIYTGSPKRDGSHLQHFFQG